MQIQWDLFPGVEGWAGPSGYWPPGLSGQVTASLDVPTPPPPSMGHIVVRRERIEFKVK